METPRKYSVPRGKLILKEEEFDFEGRVARWRKRRASTVVSDLGGDDAGIREIAQREEQADNTIGDTVLTQADAD